MANGAPQVSSTFKRDLGKGRILQFIFCTLFFGLLQLWIVLVVGKSPSFGQLFGDGGVFFFATSLLVSSTLSLLDRGLLRAGSAELTITFVVAAPTFLLAIVTYSAIVSGQFSSATPSLTPFASKAWHQIASGAVATIYAIFTAIRTGQLAK